MSPSPPSTPKEPEPSILVIGSVLKPSKKAWPFTFATGLPSCPTIHDFAILIVRYSNDSFQRTPREKWEEWREFRKTGGIGFVFGIDPTIQRHSDKVVERPFPRLEPQTGRRVAWVRGTRYYEALKSRREVEWNVIVPRSEEHLISVLGRNAAGDAIAFEIASGRSSIVFLPCFDLQAREELAPQLVEGAKRQLALMSSTTMVPEWVDSLKLASELKFRAEAEIISNRVQSLSRAKRIIVEDGKALSKECARILTDMLGPEGFAVQWREEEGNHDIDIVGSTVSIVAEVRGSSGIIDVEAGRQLLHHVQQFIPITADVKGVLIGNPYRMLHLAARGQAFSAPCIELARTNHYCLITTVQLLGLYDDFNRKTLQPQDLISLLISTAGPLAREAPEWAK